MYPRWKERYYYYSQIKIPCLLFKSQVFQHKLSCSLEVQAKSIKMPDILQYIENNIIIKKYKHKPY